MPWLCGLRLSLQSLPVAWEKEFFQSIERIYMQWPSSRSLHSARGSKSSKFPLLYRSKVKTSGAKRSEVLDKNRTSPGYIQNDGLVMIIG